MAASLLTSGGGFYRTTAREMESEMETVAASQQQRVAAAPVVRDLEETALQVKFEENGDRGRSIWTSCEDLATLQVELETENENLQKRRESLQLEIAEMEKNKLKCQEEEILTNFRQSIDKIEISIAPVKEENDKILK